MKVLISGAGIAGLTVAYWLRHYGFTPTIVERAASLVTGGYKIDVRGSALQVLTRMGIYDGKHRHAGCTARRQRRYRRQGNDRRCIWTPRRRRSGDRPRYVMSDPDGSHF